MSSVGTEQQKPGTGWVGWLGPAGKVSPSLTGRDRQPRVWGMAQSLFWKHKNSAQKEKNIQMYLNAENDLSVVTLSFFFLLRESTVFNW